jgi:hypothetical protein
MFVYSKGTSQNGILLSAVPEILQHGNILGSRQNNFSPTASASA